MNDFRLYTPTQIVFGRGAEEQAGQLIRSFGGTRVLVHYGGRSAGTAAFWTGCSAAWTGRGCPTRSWAARCPTPGCPRCGRG